MKLTGKPGCVCYFMGWRGKRAVRPFHTASGPQMPRAGPSNGELYRFGLPTDPERLSLCTSQYLWVLAKIRHDQFVSAKWLTAASELTRRHLSLNIHTGCCVVQSAKVAWLFFSLCSKDGVIPITTTEKRVAKAFYKHCLLDFKLLLNAEYVPDSSVYIII